MRVAGIRIAALLAAGVAQADVNGIPQAIYDHTLDRFLAEQIGTACPDLTFDRAQADFTSKLVEASSGLSAPELTALAGKMPMDRLAADLAALYATHAITPTDPATFCEAGQRAMAENSPIGAMLKGK